MADRPTARCRGRRHRVVRAPSDPDGRTPWTRRPATPCRSRSIPASPSAPASATEGPAGSRTNPLLFNGGGHDPIRERHAARRQPAVGVHPDRPSRWAPACRASCQKSVFTDVYGGNLSATSRPAFAVCSRRSSGPSGCGCSCSAASRTTTASTGTPTARSLAAVIPRRARQRVHRRGVQPQLVDGGSARSLRHPVHVPVRVRAPDGRGLPERQQDGQHPAVPGDLPPASARLVQWQQLWPRLRARPADQQELVTAGRRGGHGVRRSPPTCFRTDWRRPMRRSPSVGTGS